MQNVWHRSKPSAPFTTVAAFLPRAGAKQPPGGGLPNSAARYFCLFQSLPIWMRDPTNPVLALAFKALRNFSQTRGTPKNTVGWHSQSVSLIEPVWIKISRRVLHAIDALVDFHTGSSLSTRPVSQNERSPR